MKLFKARVQTWNRRGEGAVYDICRCLPTEESLIVWYRTGDEDRRDVIAWRHVVSLRPLEEKPVGFKVDPTARVKLRFEEPTEETDNEKLAAGQGV